MANEIRVVIADDHPVVRQGLRLVLERDPALTVVAEAADGVAALEQIEAHRPNIAVLDLDMPKKDGFAVLRELQRVQSDVSIVLLTIHGEEDLFHNAIDLGARGYILKESALCEIVQGLKAVAAGQHYVSPPLTSFLLQRRSRGRRLAEKQPGIGELTPTERRILTMIAADKSSKQIAVELFIHYRTVENHRTSICQKLGLHGPHALLRFALQHRSEL